MNHLFKVKFKYSTLSNNKKNNKKIIIKKIIISLGLSQVLPMVTPLSLRLIGNNKDIHYFISLMSKESVQL
jgi:hypothetical protein